MSEKKTYGQKVFEHHAKNLTLEDDIIEYRKQMEGELMAKLYATADEAKKKPLYSNKDFYVVLLNKIERIGQAVRSFILARRSCPTPIYKQSVWKYHHQVGKLEFLWSIPDKILYYNIINNSNKYLNDPETKILAQFVILMESGDLLNWVKKENGNKKDAIIFLNKEAECQIQ